MILEIIEVDFANQVHQISFIDLVNSYIKDPMGGGKLLTDPALQEQLIEGLKNHPAALVMFALADHKPVGMVTCFIGFSTFRVKKLVNIHDIVVLPQYRGQGIGRKLLLAVEKKARELGCCKTTLEVRTDNEKAMGLYRSLGFGEGTHPMYFWSKPLE